MVQESMDVRQGARLTGSERASGFRRIEPVLKRVLVALGLVSLGWQWIAAAIRPHGDFVQFLESGRRFLHGTFFYERGHMVPYTLLWAMVYAPFALLPARLAMPLFFLIGFTALAALTKLLARLTCMRDVLDERKAFWLVALTAVLTSRFWIRDFADGGQNTVLLTLTWGAIYFHLRDRSFSAGALLGLATALKCTPFVFIAFFAFKRAWKTAAAAALFTALFLLLPLCFRDPALYSREMNTWAANVWAGVTSKNPSVGILGEEPLSNSSLKSALSRYLMTLPPGHLGRLPGPNHVDFLDLSPEAASRVIRVVMLLGAAVLVCNFRRAAPAGVSSDNRQTDIFLAECACVSVAALLASPITWGQHCVGTIPLVYLLVLHRLRGNAFPRTVTLLLSVAAATVLFTSRGILGKPLALLIQSYHADTLALVFLLVAGLWFHSNARQEPVRN